MVRSKNLPDLKTLEEVEDEIVVDADNVTDVIKLPPPRTSPEWSDYVMSLMTPDELDKDKPRVHGLRRVAKIICSEDDIGTNATLLDVPSEVNGRRYVAQYTLEIHGKVWQDIGDCACGDSFAQYPAALATTRAEARVYRKMLGVNVCSAEEIRADEEVKAEKTWTPDVEPEYITDTQKNYMNTICKKLKINLTDVLEEIGVSGPMNKISNEKAKEIISTLNEKVRK